MISVFTWSIIVLSAIAFGLLGFLTGNANKPQLKWQIRFTVLIALVACLVTLLLGDWTMLGIAGPWLLGLGLGKLLRR